MIGMECGQAKWHCSLVFERISAAALVTIFLAACAFEPTFAKPQLSVGRSVAVTGYLRFGFENRNLFPSERWEEHYRRGECLPVGIRSADAALLARAQQLDGRLVTVTGKIDRLVRPDEINASFCKDIGILVARIEAS